MSRAVGRLLRGGHLRWDGHAASRAVTATTQLTKQNERSRLGLNAEFYDDKPDKSRLRPLPSPDRPLELRRASIELKKQTQAGAHEAAWEGFRGTPEPDAVLYCGALHLCARAGWWERGSCLWAEMPQGWREEVAFSTMIALCAKCCKVEAAELLFAEMRQLGHVPNVITCINMVKAYGMAKDPEKAVGAFRAMAEMLAEADVRTKKSAYQVVMTSCMRAGDYAGTRELFIEMVQAGVPVEPSHYTTLMSACAHGGHAELAEGVFRQMVQLGLPPDVTHYTVLISCNRRNLQRCLEVREEMRRTGIAPSALTYQELLRAHVMAKDAAGGRALLEEVGAATAWDAHGHMAKLRAALLAMPA